MSNSTKQFKSVGVKSGYQGFQTQGLRGTIYIPKGFFAANAVPDELSITAPFAAPAPTKASAEALTAEVEALKAQLAAALAAIPESKKRSA